MTGLRNKDPRVNQKLYIIIKVNYCIEKVEKLGLVFILSKKEKKISKKMKKNIFFSFFTINLDNLEKSEHKYAINMPFFEGKNCFFQKNINFELKK